MMMMVEDYDYVDDYDDNDGSNTDDKMLMIKKLRLSPYCTYVQRFWRSGGTDNVGALVTLTKPDR
jgi:hypothetical protein